MSQRRVPLLLFNPHAIYTSNCSKVFEPVGQSTLWSSHLVKLRLGILWINLQSYWSAYPHCPEGIGFSLIIKCCTTVNHCKSKFAFFAIAISIHVESMSCLAHPGAPRTQRNQVCLLPSDPSLPFALLSPPSPHNFHPL